MVLQPRGNSAHHRENGVEMTGKGKKRNLHHVQVSGTEESLRGRAFPWSLEQTECLVLCSCPSYLPKPPDPCSAMGCSPATHLHKPPGLSDDRILEAVQGEAVNLPQEPDWGLSDSPHQGIGPVHGGRGRLWVWDQLHQWHVIRWVDLGREMGGES